jgi:hypothetical protein
MQALELLSLTLDVLLVICAILAYRARPRIGGEVARGLQILLIGVIVLGLAHLVETLLFTLFNLDTRTNEVVHRLLIVGGFVFVIQGFSVMRRAFGR